MSQRLLEMKNIYKGFTGVQALEDVSISLDKGQVLALLGENGAGKSTLIKILAGVHQRDSGEILVEGKTVNFHNPQDAIRVGIGVIYQELCVAREMTIAENIFLGREPLKKGSLMVDYKYMNTVTQELLDRLELDLNAGQKVFTLSIAQQQMIEIARVVHLSAKIIVMDEPTSSLSQKEALKLFVLTENLRNQGLGIIYISHRLEEVFIVADEIAVLRDGKVAGEGSVADMSHDDIVKMMVGRSFDDFYQKEKNAKDEVVFQVKDLVGTYSPHKVSFDVRKGEILGVCGLVGAGRSEIIRTLFGVDPKVSGEVYLDGKQVTINKPEDAIDIGIALVPEDRKGEGLIIENTVAYNLSLMALKKIIGRFGVNKKEEAKIVNEQIGALNIKTYSHSQIVAQLSGGNQQKIVLGKWLATKLRLLILDEPTRGIDVGAKSEIYGIMNQLTKQGVSIIMITSELQEGIGMSDRIVVMADGKVTAILDEGESNQETVMRYALGIAKE